jgi:trans-2,3-dihydro-3-hydroxyanthranilate isomerase
MAHETFTIVDVFAEAKYHGNQLAVFHDAGGLDPAEMQRIAREINFSETTFIVKNGSREKPFGVRIFTPREEVPFAGHPTLGTAHVIRQSILREPVAEITLDLPIGPITVTFADDGYAWMRQNPPEFRRVRDRARAAAVLDLDIRDLDDRFPVQEVTTGLPFTIVPLRSLRALKRARTNRDAYFMFVADTDAKGILLFSAETHEPENDLSVRVFVEAFGVPEDPATGSGNGCLAAYLVRHRYFGGETVSVRSEQGYEIGRPSLLLLDAEERGGEIVVRVGGRTVAVATGSLL